MAFQYIKMTYKEDGGRSSTKALSDRKRGNDFKLKEGRFKVNIRKKFFMMWLMGHWSRFCKDAVGCDFEQLDPME